MYTTLQSCRCIYTTILRHHFATVGNVTVRHGQSRETQIFYCKHLRELLRSVRVPCVEEVEIRACTVQAVERMKAALTARLAREPELAGAGAGARAAGATGAAGLTSVAIDWFLWSEGEAMRDDSPPHHRTLTVYY